MVTWKKYNGALVPETPPHIAPTAQDVKAAKKLGGYRFISYVTDFDCAEETAWWYVIKDTPLQLEELPSSRRYKINKGLRYAEIRKINPVEYGSMIYRCFIKAQERYEAFESVITEEAFLKSLHEEDAEYYAAFFKETNEMIAYAKNLLNGECLSMSVIKFDPEYLKYQISAALIYQIVFDYINTGRCKYVSDGQRAIRHKTNVQDYLEDYFGFRKAYCRLHMVYSPMMKVTVSLLYPFRKWVEKLAGKRVFLNNVASVLKMEEIQRNCRKKNA